MNFFLVSLLLLYSFPQIDEKIPSGPFSYPGLSSREVILVDPQNSPLLYQATLDHKALLKESYAEEEILLSTLIFVRETLFEFPKCTQNHVQDLICRYYDEKAEIPLDFFLQSRTGVCRHLALTTTYLIQTLIDEGRLQGEVFLIREQIPCGKHAWTLFLSEKGAWHLDPLWGIFANGKISSDFCHLCQKYGKRTMERQKMRWEK